MDCLNGALPHKKIPPHLLCEGIILWVIKFGSVNQNKSECVPVPVNKSTSSVSFCSQIRSQSGFR
jgi:hypothetical protein